MITNEHFYYLGLTLNRQLDTLSLRSKPIYLRSKSKGPVNVIIRNINEFKSFLAADKFNKTHLAALVNAVFCPQGHLSAIYSNVSKKIMNHIVVDSTIKLTWTSIIDK